MMETHDKILDMLEDDLKRLQSKFTNKYHYIFNNYRQSRGEKNGIRLSRVGRKLLSKYNEEFTYQHTTKLTGSMLLNLERKMTWPYYIDSQYITFFSAEDSAWFRIYDENIDNFLKDF
jgi:hypothetical protein